MTATTTLTPVKLNQLVNKAKYLGYKLLIDDIADYVTVTPLDREDYTAEVYKSYKGQWEVQTTSYGTVSPETVDLVVYGLKRAQELAELLDDAGL